MIDKELERIEREYRLDRKKLIFQSERDVAMLVAEVKRLKRELASLTSVVEKLEEKSLKSSSIGNHRSF